MNLRASRGQLAYERHALMNFNLQCRLRPSSDGPEEVGITLGCECVEKSELYDLAVTVLHCYTQMLTVRHILLCLNGIIENIL